MSTIHLNGNKNNKNDNTDNAVTGNNTGTTSTATTRSNKRLYSNRRRYPPSQFQASTAAEERFLQQAIQNSKLEYNRFVNKDNNSNNNVHNDDNNNNNNNKYLNIPFGPVFYPTIEEFEKNPIHYVEKIRPIAEKYGICKIIPPIGWNPGSQFSVDLNTKQKFQTKQQLLHRLQEGISFGDGIEYTPSEYLHMASERTNLYKNTNYPDHDLLYKHYDTLLHKEQLQQKEKEQQQQQELDNNIEMNTSTNSKASTDININTNININTSSIKDKLFIPENLENDYWNIVEKSKEYIVEYGNDIDTQLYGTGFPLSERGRALNGTKIQSKINLNEPKFNELDYYKETWWNLNNIPCAPDSVLRHVKVGITGINVPWMYYGSLFTTFCWHNEDNHLYSINYHHKGAPKQWYGIPGSKDCADGLEKVFKSYLSMKMKDVPDLLHHITTMFSPRLLLNANVNVTKLIQYEGEFIITFPRSFHSGYSLGPNIGEAVNFATYNWIAYGSDANERYRSFARPAVFSHDRLTFTMANHLYEQKTYITCKRLLIEIERVVNEELKLRTKLLNDGIRDVSKLIKLPKNYLNELNEESALYDDKRLCHACKHICFFSAIACECSQSKVSCLRHSHYMCRCPSKRKYFMIWCTNDELKLTLNNVNKHCNKLLLQQNEADNISKTDITTSSPIKIISSSTTKSNTNNNSIDSINFCRDINSTLSLSSSETVPGAIEDQLLHKNYDIPTGIITQESFLIPTDISLRLLKRKQEEQQQKQNELVNNSTNHEAVINNNINNIELFSSIISTDDENNTNKNNISNTVNQIPISSTIISASSSLSTITSASTTLKKRTYEESSCISNGNVNDDKNNKN